MPRFALTLPILVLTGVLSAAPALAETPAVGDPAPDFTLATLGGGDTRLSDVTAKHPVVLVVLRGYPGYQCPICSRQVGAFIANAKRFRKAEVVMVYPGPPDSLAQRAQEFVAGRVLPKRFRMLLDPDYAFTNQYGLRWDAPRETAYPSTFVIDRKGVVRFVKTSRTHGDRATPEEIAAALRAL